MGAKRLNTYGKMTYLKMKNIDKAIRQKPSKKNVYKTERHNIYNLIVGHNNDQLKKKSAIEANLQAVNSGRDPIVYLMILRKLCF